MPIQNILRACVTILWIISNLYIPTIASTILPTPRIAGGEAVDISEAKFVVQVITDDLCGGSLVTPTHVITAAHCVENRKPSDITVIGGASYINTGGLRRTVDKIYAPEEFLYKNLSWDIAVLKLSSPLEGRNIATIKLCSQQWNDGALFKVYGWGDTGTEIPSPKQVFSVPIIHFPISCLFQSTQLRVVEVPTLPLRECDKYLVKMAVPSVMFCAGVHGEKDSCRGDSGGPAVYNNELCGVVAMGKPCPTIGFYVNINHVKDFVENVIQMTE